MSVGDKVAMKDRMATLLSLFPERVNCTNNEIVLFYTDFYHPEIKTKKELLEQVSIEGITRTFRKAKELLSEMTEITQSDQRAAATREEEIEYVQTFASGWKRKVRKK